MSEIGWQAIARAAQRQRDKTFAERDHPRDLAARYLDEIERLTDALERSVEFATPAGRSIIRAALAPVHDLPGDEAVYERAASVLGSVATITAERDHARDLAARLEEEVARKDEALGWIAYECENPNYDLTVCSEPIGPGSCDKCIARAALAPVHDLPGDTDV